MLAVEAETVPGLTHVLGGRVREQGVDVDLSVVVAEAVVGVIVGRGGRGWGGEEREEGLLLLLLLLEGVVLDVWGGVLLLLLLLGMVHLRGRRRRGVRPLGSVEGVLRRERRWRTNILLLPLRAQLPAPHIPCKRPIPSRLLREQVPQVHVELGPRSLGAEVALVVLRLDEALRLLRRELRLGLRGRGAGVGGPRRREVWNAGAEAGGREAHVHGGFAHALEGVAAGFGGGAFVDQVAEDRGRGEDGEVDIVEGLGGVNEAERSGLGLARLDTWDRNTYQLAADRGRMPNRV